MTGEQDEVTVGRIETGERVAFQEDWLAVVIEPEIDAGEIAAAEQPVCRPCISRQFRELLFGKPGRCVIVN